MMTRRGRFSSLRSSPLEAQQVEEADPSDLQRLFELCRALKTSDKLPSYANTKAQQLLEKMEALEHVLERGGRAVGAILDGLRNAHLTGDKKTPKSSAPSK